MGFERGRGRATRVAEQVGVRKSQNPHPYKARVRHPNFLSPIVCAPRAGTQIFAWRLAVGHCPFPTYGRKTFYSTLETTLAVNRLPVTWNVLTPQKGEKSLNAQARSQHLGWLFTSRLVWTDPTKLREERLHAVAANLVHWRPVPDFFGSIS